MHRFLILLFLFHVAPKLVFSQIQQPQNYLKHIANFQFGYDYSLVSMNLGYMRYFHTIRAGAYTDFTQSSALLGTPNFRSRFGLSYWVNPSEILKAKSSFGMVISNSKNLAGLYTGIGLDCRIQAGFLLLKRFFIGFDLDYNPFLATHIKHSDYFIINYLETAKNGWYNLTAQNLRLGAITTINLGKNNTHEIGIRGGYQTSGHLDKLIPGFYTQFLYSYLIK